MARRRRPSGGEESTMNMSAMIDVVFQLLIFFMLTLKIVEPEGDFNVNMPAQGQPTPDDVVPPLDIKVKLRANPDGTLAGLYIGQRPLGVGPAAFRALNIEILKIIGSPGNELTKDTSVEIDADYNLHFHNVISAIGACTGTLDQRTGNVVKYIEKIKFAPPKPPTGG